LCEYVKKLRTFKKGNNDLKSGIIDWSPFVKYRIFIKILMYLNCILCVLGNKNSSWNKIEKYEDYVDMRFKLDIILIYNLLTF
jgi:hypothetical protein